MRLADFIKKEEEAIAEEWIEYATNFIDSAKDMSKEAIKDHVLEMLRQIVEEMATPQTDSEQKDKSRGLRAPGLRENQPAKEHGIQRVEAGFDIVQVSSEFRALRASVLRLWEANRVSGPSEEKIQDLIRFNEAIDEAWMHSITYYHNKMDRSKNWFLGILGHDLRSPLAALKGAQQLLHLSDNLSGEEKELLQQTDISIQRMNELIENLLGLTNLRLGSGISIEKRASDLSQQCQIILQEFKLTYPEADFRFESPGPIQGEWDRVRMEQVLSNLIGNALRYGKPGGPVTVKAAAEDEEVCLSVHNEGNPIPESRREIIFKGLYTDSAELNGKKESSYGIGLYVVQEIAQAHGGRIELESSEEAGTTFKVIIPRR